MGGSAQTLHFWSSTTWSLATTASCNFIWPPRLMNDECADRGRSAPGFARLRYRDARGEAGRATANELCRVRACTFVSHGASIRRLIASKRALCENRYDFLLIPL